MSGRAAAHLLGLLKSTAPRAEVTAPSLDSYRYHHSRHASELDRRREREAHARGDQFRRYTYGDVVEAPAAMLAELRAMVPRRRPPERS